MSENNEKLDQFKNTRFGYSGKPKQWQYGFDLAWREQQDFINRLMAENAELIKANMDVAKINADYLFDNIELKNQLEQLQKQFDFLSARNLKQRIEIAKHALSTFYPPKPAKVSWFAFFKKIGK